MIRKWVALIAVAVMAVGMPARGSSAELTFGDIAAAVVKVEAKIKPGARTAPTLGLNRSGSGVVIAADGLILTIGYITMESQALSVSTRAGKTMPATFVAYDHRTGFGLLRANGDLGVRPLNLGEPAELKAGAPMLVLSSGQSRPVTPVRVVSRRPFAGYWEYLLDRAIYTMPMHPEYGGAALVDLKGNLSGIGSLFINDAMEPGEPAPGNMFVPVDLLKPILAKLIEQGRSGSSARPWIGVYTTEAEGKLVVKRVANDGPGAAAGVKPGDIIIGVNGRKISDMAELFRIVWSSGDAGVDVPLDVLPYGAQSLEIKKITVRSRDRHKWLRLGHE